MLEDLQRGHEGLIVKLNDVIRALKVRQISFVYFNRALNSSVQSVVFTIFFFSPVLFFMSSIELLESHTNQ